MFARTERLLLRPGFVEDAPMLAATIGEAAIARNLSRLPLPYREEDARCWLSRPSLPGEYSLLVFMRTAGDPRLVGGIGLNPVALRDDSGGHDWGTGPALELGYWVARPYWGLGIATEAGRAILAAARAIKCPPIVSAHFVDNSASGRVLNKLGLRPTGRIVQRHSAGRRADVPCLLFVLPEEGDTETGDPSALADMVYRDREPEPDRAMVSRLAA